MPPIPFMTNMPVNYFVKSGSVLILHGHPESFYVVGDFGYKVCAESGTIVAAVEMSRYSKNTLKLEEKYDAPIWMIGELLKDSELYLSSESEFYEGLHAARAKNKTNASKP